MNGLVRVNFIDHHRNSFKAVGTEREVRIAETAADPLQAMLDAQFDLLFVR
jgi:hypothetical protein